MTTSTNNRKKTKIARHNSRGDDSKMCERKFLFVNVDDFRDLNK